MKKNLVFIFLIYFSVQVFSQSDIFSINVMTFNIRYNNPNDGVNAWPNRKQNVTSMIRFYDADIVGCQEALIDQITYLDKSLPDYNWYGLGRDDGKDAGEIMGILYKTDKFNVLLDSTIWLSPTPTIPGLGWDAACNRTITILKIQDKKTQKEFFMFNTHFDHRGIKAREQSSKLLIKSVAEIAGNMPFVITGDFNAGTDSEPYKLLTSNSNTPLILDTKNISQIPHHGPIGTSTGFKIENIGRKKSIDYIFVGNGVKVIRHGTLSDTFDGLLPSDHFPVFAELVFP